RPRAAGGGGALPGPPSGPRPGHAASAADGPRALRRRLLAGLLPRRRAPGRDLRRGPAGLVGPGGQAGGQPAGARSVRPPRPRVRAGGPAPGGRQRRRHRLRLAAQTPLTLCPDEGEKLGTFFQNALATASDEGITEIVPPYGSFGDWATPK